MTRGWAVLAALAALAAAGVPASPAGAQSAEWPGLVRALCGACHNRARELLADHIDHRDGSLFARRSGIELRAFLTRHSGPRSEADIEAIHRELLRVAAGEGRFRQQCAICHVSAETLAHDRLVLRGGALYGRYSGREIGAYLTRHGRLATPQDAAFFEDVLRRALPAPR